MEAKIDKCSIYTDRFRRQLVSLSLEQFKSFTERNSTHLFSILLPNAAAQSRYRQARKRPPKK